MGVIWPVLQTSWKEERKRERGWSRGGSEKCKLIGSKSVLMFTATFAEQHLAQICYSTESTYPQPPPPRKEFS